VINESGQPISFDSLIGAVTLRQNGSAVSSFAAIPIPAIPADPNQPPGQPLQFPDGALIFDGGKGHYAELSSRVRQNFRSKQALGPAPPGGFATASITLLTLDVRSNRPNLPTFVPLEFFNEDGQRTSTSIEFVCWTEQRLDAIDPNLTFEQMGTRWGLAFSGQAIKRPFLGVSDKPGPVTLMGLIEVFEGPATAVRTLIFPLSPVESPVTTKFLP
jgi:hypothetical protein